MIIGIIVCLFCAAGIYGFYNDLMFLTYIGMVSSIIEMIIGVATGESKSLMTLWFCLILAIGAAIAGNNFIESFAVFLCYENVILFVVGILMLLLGNAKPKESIANNNEEEPFDRYIIDRVGRTGTRTSFGELRNDNSDSISAIVNNQERLLNIIDGIETVNSELFIGKQNPYTGIVISNYDDIITYLRMYKTDLEGGNPTSIESKKEAE